jgi:hypothetical protein
MPGLSVLNSTRATLIILLQFGDVIEVIQGTIETIELPEKVIDTVMWAPTGRLAWKPVHYGRAVGSASWV